MYKQCKTIAVAFGIIDIVPSARGTSATEVRGRQSSVSSFRSVLPRMFLQRVKRSDFCRTNRKNETSDTYRQCGGLRGILSSTVLSLIQFNSPRYLPQSHRQYIFDGSRFSRFISTGNGLLRFPRSFQYLHVHFKCSLWHPEKIKRDH